MTIVLHADDLQKLLAEWVCEHLGDEWVLDVDDREPVYIENELVHVALRIAPEAK